VGGKRQKVEGKRLKAKGKGGKSRYKVQGTRDKDLFDK
jgi:hypothetical protein